MARIGCFCLPATGHLYPLSALAHELRTRGHELLFFNLLDSKHAIERNGLRFVPICEETYPAESIPQRYRELGELTGMAAIQYTFRWLAEYARAVASEAPGVVERFGLEFMLVDQVDYAAATLARHVEVPFATVALALMTNYENGVPGNSDIPYSDDPITKEKLRHFQAGYLQVSAPYYQAVNDYRMLIGLPTVTTMDPVFSPMAQITQQPAGFEYPRRALPDWFHFTGPFSNSSLRPDVPFPFETLNGKPLIFASLGTVQNRCSYLFRNIAESCLGLEAKVVLSLGGGISADEVGELPGNPILVNYAPQLELLKRAALMITHAGLNSALECLAAGVPTVAIPIANDQPGVAARLAWTGAGTVVPLAAADPPRIRNAVTEVLTNPSYRNTAQRFRREIEATNRLLRAADIIEHAIATRAPVLRDEFSAVNA